MFDPSPSTDSWRIDRRTFLKLMGISGAGLLATGSLGAFLDPLGTSPVAAATGPIDDLALALEFDTERIFRFVSEQIRYEPYAGVLRGAEGTLMARAGNAADQAALLATLLKASGVETRFAWGAIDPATSDVLLRSGITDVATGRVQLIETLSGMGDGGRPLPALELDAETSARLEEAIARAPSVVEWANGQTTATVGELESALRSAGIVLPSGFPAVPTMERDRHLWVQMMVGPGWLDLDPSIPGALPGDAAAEPAEVVDAIPDDLRHTIRLRVIEETASGGAVGERTLLEVSDFADAAGGLPVSVFNLDFVGAKAIGVNIMGLLEGGTSYIPGVSIGESVFVGPGWFRVGSSEAPGPFDEPATPADVFGGTAGEITAEWIEATVSSPAAEPVTIRRPMFDRTGPAARSAGPVDLGSVAPATLVQLDPDGPFDYLPALRVHVLTVHNGIVGGETLGAALRPTGTDASLAGVVHAYHVVREGTGVEVATPEGVRPFVDAPNLVSLTVAPEMDADGSLAFRSMLDIWHRSFGTLPVAATAPTTTPLVVAGVTSHVAERLVFGEAVPGDAGTAEVVSVGAIFDAARREGVPLRVVQDLDDVASLPYAPDTLARLRESIATGRVAVAPERPLPIAGADRAGWWLIDPATGVTTDQLDDGRGATATEDTVIIVRRAEDASTLKRLGLCTFFMVSVAVGMFEVYAAIDNAAKGGPLAASAMLGMTGAKSATGGGVVGLPGCAA